MGKKRRLPQHVPTYSPFAELVADPVKPIPESMKVPHLTKMYEGLDILRHAQPSVEHWQVVSDAINLTKTLTTEMQICEDPEGVVDKALQSIHTAWTRYSESQLPITDDEYANLCWLLRDYGELLEYLPERTLIRCHRITEKRMHEVLNGNRKPGDIII